MAGFSRHGMAPMVAAAGFEVRAARAGDHMVEFLSLPAGDYEGLLAGLADGCEAIHYGYVVKGRVRFRYADGSVEDYAAGDAFHAPPGHHFEALEASEVVGFTVVDEDHGRMQAAIQRNLPGFLERWSKQADEASARGAPGRR